jgi:CRP-like cAMP-binding protein
MSDTDRARSFLRRAGWLSGHAPELIDALVAEGALVRLGAGQWAQAEGDDETGLLLVVEGAVQLYCQAPGDREVLVGHAGPGATLGQTLRFGGGPRLTTAICVEPSVLLKVSDAALTRIGARRPEVWRAVATLVYLQLRGALMMAAEAVALPPLQRLAGRLVMLMRAMDGPRTLKLSQQALGELVGLTRKSVNLFLGELEAAGLVRLGYGELEVLDLEGLRRVAGS